MPIVNSEDNQQYDFYVDGIPVTIQVFHAHPKPYYYRAIVNGETVENYADTESEAHIKARDGIDWLIAGQADDSEGK